MATDYDYSAADYREIAAATSRNAAEWRRELLTAWTPSARDVAECASALDEAARLYDLAGEPVAAKEARRQARTLRNVRGA